MSTWYDNIKAFIANNIRTNRKHEITGEKMNTVLNGIVDEVENKVDKEEGKVLSTNDYTDADKAKVASALQSEADPTVPSWAKSQTKPTYTASEVGAIPSTDKGANGGVATLDSGGKVPQSQLPSYVDDVLEYSNRASFPATGESGKIYVALDSNKTYRWSGSGYVEIAQGLALGETSSTAFAGDRGKAIEDKIPTNASSSNKLATMEDLPSDISELTDGKLYGGTINTQSTVQPDTSCYYIAEEGGTYQAFGVTVNANERVQIIIHNGTSWEVVSLNTYNYGYSHGKFDKVDDIDSLLTDIVPSSASSSNKLVTERERHFKGWFNSLAELKAAHTATEGDSAYVKDASPATTWSIYVYDVTATSDNYWADSGTDADTSHVQTFASGEEVNEVHINDTITDNDSIIKGSGIYPIYREMFGGNGYVAITKIGTIQSYMAVSRGGGYSNSSTYVTNIYQIEQGKKYKISVPLAGNTAMYTLGYTEYATLMDKSYYTDAHVFEFTDTVGTSEAFTYMIDSAENYPCLMISYMASGGEPVVETPVTLASIVVKTEQQQFTEEAKTQARENIGAASVEDVSDIPDIRDQIYYTEEKNVQWVDNMLAVIPSAPSLPYFRSNIAGWKCSLPILLKRGETVRVTTAANASYVTCIVGKVSGPNAPISNTYHFDVLVPRINTSVNDYSYTAIEDTWIFICGTSDCTYSFSNLEKLSKIDKLESEVNLISPCLHNSKIMFFGASNTANSTTGVVGFPELIAQDAGIEYRAFLADSAQGNTADIPVEYPNVTNYAKDGTCLRVIDGRTDGVLPRVKRHITSENYPDYCIIMFPANDAANDYINIGEVSASYTAVFDTDTQLGALEEICRYISELGAPVKFGCIIPWEIKWVPSNFYDSYISVLDKWRIPYIDLRKCAGFDVKNIVAQSNLLTLTTENYSAWDSATTYNLDDKVKHGGVLYKCKADGVVGIVPTNSTYWMEVSSGSSDGTHLNSLGNKIVVGKIRQFIEGL